jgi:peptidoglycan biosynthesis protein MviN/MurJ (putative lipid II flippase)
MAVMSYYKAQQPEIQPHVKRLFWISMTSYFTGGLLWVLEHIFCDFVRPAQFHAIWHLLAGVGTYLFIQYLVALRIVRHKKRVEFAHTLGTIHVTAHDKE